MPLLLKRSFSKINFAMPTMVHYPVLCMPYLYKFVAGMAVSLKQAQLMLELLEAAQKSFCSALLPKSFCNASHGELSDTLHALFVQGNPWLPWLSHLNKCNISCHGTDGHNALTLHNALRLQSTIHRKSRANGVMFSPSVCRHQIQSTLTSACNKP